jgi:hypothetical protein
MPWFEVAMREVPAPVDQSQAALSRGWHFLHVQPRFPYAGARQAPCAFGAHSRLLRAGEGLHREEEPSR